MIRGCFLAGLLLTTQCQMRPHLFATDRPRCKSDPHRLKVPPIKRERR